MSDAAEMKTCPSCGESSLAVAENCQYCGESLDEAAPGAKKPAPSAMVRMFAPVGRPVSAIASGYLGLIGILCPMPFSIAAVITGFVALNTLKKHPELSGAGRAWFGIICGSIMILKVLEGIVALLVLMSRPGRPPGF